MKYFDTNIYDAVQKLSQEFFFGMFNMRCQQFDSKLPLIESYCSFRQNSFLRKFVHSFEVNIFFRRWSFFAFACFFNLLFSCARLLHSFFTLRYLRVYFLCVVFPFWSQSCKFSGKVFKCFTSISLVYFGVIQILFERLIFCKTCCQYWRKNKIRWKRKHCDFPVLTKGRCPYSSCHIYWPTVESTFDLVLTLLIGHRCLIIEFCFKVLYSCNSL